MDADFLEAVIANKCKEVMRVVEEALAIGHDHGVEVDCEGVGDDATEVINGEEGDFSGRDLDFATEALCGSQGIELLLNFGEGEGFGFVGIGREIATGAGEVATLHDVVGGSTGHRCLPEDLGREAEFFGELFPSLTEEGPGLMGGGWVAKGVFHGKVP